MNEAQNVTDQQHEGVTDYLTRSTTSTSVLEGDLPMAATSTWSSDELGRIEAADELKIAPRQADGSLSKPVTIWVVRLGDDLYVRSVRGRTSVWFRGAGVRHQAHVLAGGVAKDVDLIETDDTNDAIDAAYRSKYHRYAKGIVDSIVSKQARGATLKLLPRS